MLAARSEGRVKRGRRRTSHRLHTRLRLAGGLQAAFQFPSRAAVTVAAVQVRTETRHHRHGCPHHLPSRPLALARHREPGHRGLRRAQPQPRACTGSTRPAVEDREPLLLREKRRPLGRPPAAQGNRGGGEDLGRHCRRDRHADLPQRRPARDRSQVRLPRLDESRRQRAQRAPGRPADHCADPGRSSRRRSNTTPPRKKERLPRCWSSTCPMCSR